LLSWFHLLLYNEKEQYNYLYEVFEVITETLWAQREIQKTGDALFGIALIDFSKKLTLHLYNAQKDKFDKEEKAKINQIAKDLNLNERIAQSRTFLTRNDDDHSWAFSHKSFFDYFLAVLLIETPILEHGFDFEKYPDTASFYNQMCWKKYAEKDTQPVDKNKIPIDLGNDLQMYKHVNSFIVNFPLLAVRAMLTSLNEQAWKEYGLLCKHSPYWEKMIGYLKTYMIGKFGQSHFIFNQHTDYDNILKGAYIEDIDSRFFLYSFICESVFEKHSALTSSMYYLIPFRKNYPDYKVEQSFKENLPLCLQKFDIGDMFDHAITRNKLVHDFPRDIENNLNFARLDLKNTNFLRIYNKKATTLTFSNNRIQEITPWISNFIELRTLDLSYNQISDLESLRAVIELPELQELYLFGNPLDEKFTGTDADFNSLRVVRDEILKMPSMIRIEGGVFEMGQRTEEPKVTYGKDKIRRFDDEQPIHKVKIDTFEIGKYAVTIGEFRLFILASKYITDAEKEDTVDGKGSNMYDFATNQWFLKENVNWECDAHGNHQTNDRHPVIHVSWNDAKEYCNWLSKEIGVECRLPTEAEWEYAAKGGHDTISHGLKYAGSNDLKEVAWYYENSGNNDTQKGTHPVGKKLPQKVGLYDMSGNVNEWCEDRYGKDYYKECVDRGLFLNPKGSETGSYRVSRGGSWYDVARRCRTAYRLNYSPFTRLVDLGFRLALSLQ
jgi:formylglycine-generating enzyme required for sulfatase activity